MIGRFVPSVFLALTSRRENRASVLAADPVYILNKDSAASRTLFLIPGIGGNILPYKKMAKHLSPHFIVKGLFFPAWVKHQQSFRSVEAYAAYFQSCIQPGSRDPVFILGYSIGGVFAFEVAKQLRASGQNVCLILFDTECPSLETSFGHLRGRVRHLGKLCEYKARGLKYYLKADARAHDKVKIKMAARYYRPSLVDLPVVLIRPEQIEPKNELLYQGDLGWRAVVKELKILTTKGNHANAYKEENAAGMALVLQDALRWLSERSKATTQDAKRAAREN